MTQADNPKLETFKQIVPLVYSWTTKDIGKYAGWQKIGYTEQASADVRIAQQASQLNIEQRRLWSQRAVFTSEEGGFFTDHEFHAYLKQLGIEREKGSEWFDFSQVDDENVSLRHLHDFASGLVVAHKQGLLTSDYVLRSEQRQAVEQALDAFTRDDLAPEVLWNAKPRFGKTLATYDLMRELDAQRVLIVTNRPAIANSWLDDFEKFIGHQTTYRFVSESPSLAGRSTMSRKDYVRLVTNADPSADIRVVEFVSLQDLKGSVYFGGHHDKLKHITDWDWDLLVIDEAHEGVDTAKTDVALDQVTRRWTLHLSGTPFKALASGSFDEEQIFNWTYLDEQQAKANWSDEATENPYLQLPKLNMLTYQMSPMITDRLSQGAAVDEAGEDADFAFDLNNFFATDERGYFEHLDDVKRFLDTLTSNEKYPFSTAELRDELRHTFWLLDRVASAKALAKLLAKHSVFSQYEVVLAAGDGRNEKADVIDEDSNKKSLEKVKEAIRQAEAKGGKTITLSVGQLTTGITVPEWTAVMMLSNIKSPALYMQAAFRAQNPCRFVRGNALMMKQNAYVFDFAPQRTLVLFDQFANNLRSNPSGDQGVRQENIRELLNFFPVLGEDSEGRMVELDAGQVLTFPQTYTAREIVRRGFLSNLLFVNVGGIFRGLRSNEAVQDVLNKLSRAEGGKLVRRELTLPDPMPEVDADGEVVVDDEAVEEKVASVLGKAVYANLGPIDAGVDEDADAMTKEVLAKVEPMMHEVRERVAQEYDLTANQKLRHEKAVAKDVTDRVARARQARRIEKAHLEDELKQVNSPAEEAEVRERIAEVDERLSADLEQICSEVVDQVPKALVESLEQKKQQTTANMAMDEVRAHLRGFARTIPMFLMAYGRRDLTLATFDQVVPDNVFEELTGISKEEFSILRDGADIEQEDGTVERFNGFFDERVFNAAVQEFLDKKAALADYFDDSLTEDIFAYIPSQKTSLVFTPQAVVTQMVDALEVHSPGIFTDKTKTFADLFSTAGLFLMELVRRLDRGLEKVIPDRDERIKHILTQQIFEMSHNEILHEITLEAVSGGIAERRAWLEGSGHFRVGNLAEMTEQEAREVMKDMLTVPESS